MIEKRKVKGAFLDLIEQKIMNIKAELDAVKDSATSETKSSMGDKYETSREMMMQDRNRLTGQMDVMMNQVATLQMIDADTMYKEVAHGCLVQANDTIFFISTAAGQLNIEGQTVFAISGEAPLSKAMRGKKIGDSLSFNEKTLSIKDIK